MGIKSNNLLADYHDFFSRSGKDAVGDYIAPGPFQTSGGNVANGNEPGNGWTYHVFTQPGTCLLYTSPSPRDRQKSRMPSSA